MNALGIGIPERVPPADHAIEPPPNLAPIDFGPGTKPYRRKCDVGRSAHALADPAYSAGSGRSLELYFCCRLCARCGAAMDIGLFATQASRQSAGPGHKGRCGDRRWHRPCHLPLSPYGLAECGARRHTARTGTGRKPASCRTCRDHSRATSYCHWNGHHTRCAESRRVTQAQFAATCGDIVEHRDCRDADGTPFQRRFVARGASHGRQRVRANRCRGGTIR